MGTKEAFSQHLLALQNRICRSLEDVDGKTKFIEDTWERPGGGGGKTRIISDGRLIEKGGVNISEVYGETPNALKEKFGMKEGEFFASGLSLVLHSHNPHIPTVHANWRYFEMYDSNHQIVQSWFGGGCDLTPYYLVEKDATHFHQVLKNMCDRHHPNFYKEFKADCDRYFFNTHREEARGLGGIFYDYLKEDRNISWMNLLAFQIDSGNSLLDAYLPIVEKHQYDSFSESQKYWQEIRRGRYVEFNLLHDRGTHFGIKTKGRTESILMSLPPTVRWDYNFKPEKGSEEEKLIDALKNPESWV
jgi:coproporphyrinogen III oxidase